MEPDIITVVSAADDAADDMLTAVLLHMVKAPLPVNHTLYCFPHRNLFVTGVEDHSFLLTGIGNSNAIQTSVVCRLAAALGIKRGAVQLYQPPILPLLTGKNLRSKLLHERVAVIKLLSHHLQRSRNTLVFNAAATVLASLISPAITCSSSCSKGMRTTSRNSSSSGQLAP